MILLKNDEVIDFLTSLPTNFSALKMTAAMFASVQSITISVFKMFY